MRITGLAPLLFALLLSACGQKGPLYLPQDGGTKADPRTPEATEPRTEKADKQ